MHKVILILIPFIVFGQDGIKPIIDMHLHDYSKDNYYVAPSPDGTSSPATYEEFKEQVVSMMAKYNIVHAVVSTNGTQNKDYPDQSGILIPGMYVEDPPKDTVQFKEFIRTGRLKVFGEIGAVYVGKTLADPEYDPFLKICDRYNIPIAIHTGGGPSNVTSFSPKFRIPKGDPYTIEEVINKYPNLRIYMMHAGTSYYEHTLELMRTYPTVYADLGVILWWDKPEMDYAEAFLRKAKKYGFIDRILFGSDQMVWPHAIEKSIHKLDSYEFLDEADKRNIFYNNAVRFLNIDD